MRSSTRLRGVAALVSAALAVGLLPAASADTGGPDGHGYTYVDSSERGGPTGGFLELRQYGGDDTGIHCDDCVQTVRAPFPVTVYGATSRRLAVSSDGNVQLGSRVVGPVLGGLPDPALRNALLPFSADLTTDTGGDGIYTATLGQAPYRRFVVQWSTHTFRTNLQEDFEVVFTEGSRDVDVEYGVVDTSAPHTVGIQRGGSSSDHLVYPGPDASFSGVLFRAPVDPETGTTTTLAASPSPSSVNTQRVTLVARVAPVGRGAPVPTGSVVFASQLGVLGTAPVGPSGRAVLRTTELRPRIGYSLFARYTGDAGHDASTSNTVRHTVSGAATTTSILLPDPATISAATPVSATVTAAPPARGPVQGADVIWTDAESGDVLATTEVRNGRTTLPGGVLPVTPPGSPAILLLAQLSSPPGTYTQSSDQVRVRVTAD